MQTYLYFPAVSLSVAVFVVIAAIPVNVRERPCGPLSAKL